MKHKGLVILILLLAGLATSIYAADVLNDYRTVGSATWATIANWQRFDGTSWVAAAAAPTNSANVITIRNGHTVTLAAGRTVDQVVVEATGQLTINTGITLLLANGADAIDMNVYGTIKNAGTITTTGVLSFANGSKYQHNWAAGTVGTIPTATWTDGSTCEIINMSGTGTTTKLQGTNQSFYDFIWNTPGQTEPVYIPGTSFRPVRHDFIMQSTGTSQLEVSGVEGIDSANARLEFTNYTQTGGTFQIRREGMNIPYAVNIAGNFNMSSGTLQGQSISGSNSTIYFTKAGTQTFLKTGGSLANYIDFVVKTGSTLDMGTSVITGGGSFTLQSGAGLIIANTAGITSSGATGSVQVTGTRTYNTAANYVFNGTSAQATGNGLTTANNVTINNSAGVTLTNSITVNGTLTQTAGAISGTRTVDGYAGNPYNYINIAENGTNMAGFTLSTSLVPANMPYKIIRQWSITQSGASLNKEVTFYWNAADDDNFVWGSLLPAVWKGATKYTPSTGNYNVSASPRWVKITSIPITSTKDTYTIGRDDEVTLPVEFSSFTAILTSDFFVRLHWITQSETEVRGFYVCRGTANDIGSAIVVSPLIEATNTSGQHSYEFIDTELTNPGTYYYWLNIQDLDGGESYYGPTTVYYDNDATHGAPGIPVVSGLQTVYPNPFNPSATIGYGLNKAATVDFTIYNTRGQIVRTFSEGQKAAGNWKIFWNGLDNNGMSCSTGVYYIKMQAGKDSFMRKAVMIK